MDKSSWRKVRLYPKEGGAAVKGAIGPKTITRLIIRALADVRQIAQASLHAAMRDSGGDLDITAKEQAAVVAILEDDLKCGPLLQPKDLGKAKKQANSCLSPIKGTSILKLGDLVLTKIPVSA